MGVWHGGVVGVGGCCGDVVGVVVLGRVGG